MMIRFFATVIFCELVHRLDVIGIFRFNCKMEVLDGKS